MISKYTLDRIDDGHYVFLERPNEVNQLLIPFRDVSLELTEGDIVEIDDDGNITVLKEDTEITLNMVNELLTKLKNKPL